MVEAWGPAVHEVVCLDSSAEMQLDVQCAGALEDLWPAETAVHLSALEDLWAAETAAHLSVLESMCAPGSELIAVQQLAKFQEDLWAAVTDVENCLQHLRAAVSALAALQHAANVLQDSWAAVTELAVLQLVAATHLGMRAAVWMLP